MLGLQFVRGLSPATASRGHSSSRCRDRSSSRCAGLSLSRSLLLRSTGSRRAGSVVVTHGPSCSAACGIFPDQGSNPCPLHWQADSQPLRHQGSPTAAILIKSLVYKISNNKGRQGTLPLKARVHFCVNVCVHMYWGAVIKELIRKQST